MKTNQFNLTTIRLDENQVLQLIKGDSKVLGVRLKDKFGDLGLIGVLQLRFLDNGFNIIVEDFACQAPIGIDTPEDLEAAIIFAKKND